MAEWDFTTKSTQASGIGNTHFYTGRELDAETGLQLNRHRYYASSLGRWLTRDQFEYNDGFNLYQFVSSSPLHYLDPLGLAGKPPCGKFILKPAKVPANPDDKYRPGIVNGIRVEFDPNGPPKCDPCKGKIKITQVIRGRYHFTGWNEPHYDIPRNRGPTT
jgi:RHS repeat-associated protein